MPQVVDRLHHHPLPRIVQRRDLLEVMEEQQFEVRQALEGVLQRGHSVPERVVRFTMRTGIPVQVID
jgi:hypothetical protein